MIRQYLVGILGLCVVGGTTALGQAPVYLSGSGPLYFEEPTGVGGRLFPLSRPLPTVDPTSRDGASLRSRTRPRYLYAGPPLMVGPVPTGYVVAHPLRLGGGTTTTYYSRAYTGSSPFSSAGTYNLYGGYATPSVPEGRPNVVVPPPSLGPILVPRR